MEHKVLISPLTYKPWIFWWVGREKGLGISQAQMICDSATGSNFNGA